VNNIPCPSIIAWYIAECQLRALTLAWSINDITTRKIVEETMVTTEQVKTIHNISVQYSVVSESLVYSGSSICE
jgi:hypothetical protein